MHFFISEWSLSEVFHEMHISVITLHLAKSPPTL